MSNDKTTMICAGCEKPYAVEDTDAPTYPMSYCSAECEADREDVADEDGTDDADAAGICLTCGCELVEGDCPGCADEYDENSLVNRIENAIRTDDEDNSERIVDRYEAATEAERAVVDDIFASLCGWTLKTLIDKKEGQ